MTKKKLVFTGCSFTAGSGWSKNNCSLECKQSPYLWTNLCANSIRSLSCLESVNLGIAGASNTEIYRQAVRAMAEFGPMIDTLFCQWTSGPRYNFHVGLELWDTSESLATHCRQHDVKLSSGEIYSRDYVRDLLDRFRAMHHLHWEILQIVEYCHTIKLLAQRLNIMNVYFVNGLCPWDLDYFCVRQSSQPEDYTPFTKQYILNINNRCDQDLHTLYEQIHRQYQAAGGIDPSSWINLYNSFLHLKTDKNYDGIHPGIKSNHLYFELISQQLNP